MALSFPLSATDVESIPVLSALPLPAGAILTDNGDGTGSFDWTPAFIQSGVYTITFAATDDSLAVDSEVVTITVLEQGNQLPTLNPIGSKVVTEGTNLAFIVVASDPESIPQLLISGLPAGASYIDNGNGTGAFSWTPSFVQSGSFSVTFFAQDDSLQVVNETITITVLESGNQSPVLAPIGPQTTTENINLNFTVSATDAESIPSLIAATLPAGASFTDNGDGTGVFDWTPSFLQSGLYNVLFITADVSLAADSEVVVITVIDAKNQAPTLAAIGPQAGVENVLLTFGVSAADAESVPSLSATGLPAGAAFVDNLNGTGSFSWTPDFLQAGVFSVTFFATDDSLAVDSEVVSITIADGGNQAPVLAAIGAQAGIENQLLTFSVSATDAESIPSLSAAGLPAGAAFVDNLNGTGSFSWTPTFLQAGVFSVTFIASDDLLAVDSEVVSITIADGGNQTPILAPIGAKSTTELVNLTFVFSATDIESIPALSAAPLPAGAAIVDSGNGVAVFSWTPSLIQGGIRSITFFATDDSLAVDSEVVIFTVLDEGNQPPLIDPIADITIAEGASLEFLVTATDVESIPSLTALGLPPGASFIDSLNGTGLFSWIPSFIQAGAYVVTFVATDDSLVTDSETVVITVTESGNQPPVITPTNDTTIDEGQLLELTFSAFDPDTGLIDITILTGTPSGAFFVDNSNSTASFSWTPTFIQAGIYQLVV
ncbi:MAG: hypothetical protein IH914_10445, partial [candidate division Zixibacteria bacterium]|nr:hypothetical protein [candidate division Zixibacteria bacterium]